MESTRSVFSALLFLSVWAQATAYQSKRLLVGINASDDEFEGFVELPSMFDDITQFDFVDGRCLHFMHIPKTAGSAIEHTLLGKPGVKTWGLHPADTKLQCEKPKFDEKPGTKCEVPGKSDRCSLWHMPPAHDEVIRKRYRTCSTFCVVRAPLQRTVSQYLFQRASTKKTKWGFVNWANHHFANAEPSERIFEEDCHLVPQIDYVFDGDGNRICNHVLPYSQLTLEFNKLMRQKGFPLKLKDRINIAASHNVEEHDLPADTQEMIRKFYREDLERLRF